MPQAPKLTALLLAATLVACTVSVPSIRSVVGSGEIITNDSGDFDQVVVSHAFQASIRQGDAFSVVIRVGDNLEEHLAVTQVGRTLCIGLRPELTLGVSRATLEAEITMPAITAIEASGLSQVTLSGFGSQDDLAVEVSGASSASGDILAGDTTMEASAASTRHTGLLREPPSGSASPPSTSEWRARTQNVKFVQPVIPM